MNKGSKQFLNKWGITSASFTRHFLKRGQLFQGEIAASPYNFAIQKAFLKSRIKRIIWSLNGTGKTKGKYSCDNNPQ